jgi:E3 ubiquitin-protein ligase TRIP12
VRISRRRLLDSAFKVFELYAGSKSQLEIEFFNEVGTGTWGA